VPDVYADVEFDSEPVLAAGSVTVVVVVPATVRDEDGTVPWAIVVAEVAVVPFIPMALV
jgi:hypothetical protein